MFTSIQKPSLGAITTKPGWHRLCAAFVMVCGLLFSAHAAAADPDVRTKENAHRHSDASDGDRVFLRTAAGLLVHDRELARLGLAKASSRELKAMALEWQQLSDRLLDQVRDRAAQSRALVPSDMSDSARNAIAMLDRAPRGPGFDDAFARRASEAISAEVKLFQDSARQMESDALRSWANSVLNDLRATQLRATTLLETRR